MIFRDQSYLTNIWGRFKAAKTEPGAFGTPDGFELCMVFMYPVTRQAFGLLLISSMLVAL